MCVLSLLSLSHFQPSMEVKGGGKRAREHSIQEEIDALNARIMTTEAEKAEWKRKAETAEREGRREDAKFAWKQYATLQQQLSTLQERLLEKEKYERTLKQAKGASIPSGLFGEGQSRSNSLILMLFISLILHHSSGGLCSSHQGVSNGAYSMER